MFPSLFRPLIRDKSSLFLLGVGLGEDSCPKVLDRSLLSPGSGELSPWLATAQEKNYHQPGGQTTSHGLMPEPTHHHAPPQRRIMRATGPRIST